VACSTRRLRIDARKDIKKAVLVFAPGWADQYTFNGVSPQPISEGSADGKVSFTLGHIPQGKHFTLFVSLQVNPTNVGHHGQTVWLYDGSTEVAAITTRSPSGRNPMDIVFRAAFAYAFIVFVMRVMGRRELSSLAPADLVLIVVLGDLIQNGGTQSDMSMTGVTIAVSTFVLLTVLSSYLAFKSSRARTVIQGQPVIVVVQDGKPIEHNMRSERLTVDDVMEEARDKEIENLDEIKFAVLEPGGKMTFIKK
jgi:hypothetical protein